MKYLKLHEAHNSNQFPNDVTLCAAALKVKITEIGIKWVCTLNAPNIVNYRLTSKYGEDFYINVERLLTDKIQISGTYPNLYKEKYKKYFHEEHTFLSKSTNWDEFFYYLSEANSIDMGKVMLKMNKESVETTEESKYEFPVDTKEFRELIENYLNKIGAKYTMEEQYGHGIAYIFRYVLTDLDGYVKFQLQTTKRNPRRSTITTWGLEQAFGIFNMKEFTKYLTDLRKIDMGKVMLKMNKE
jgi:hypothetical protein